MKNHSIAPATLLPDVLAAATFACTMLRNEFHRDGGPRLEAGKPVIDLEVERFLRGALPNLHPAAWHGEETDRARIGAGDIWVVDPLDGTSDFMHGLRGAALSIALLRDGIPVLGVVASPVAPDDDGDMIGWAEGTALVRNGRPARPKLPRAVPLIGVSSTVADYAAHHAATLGGMRAMGMPSPARRLSLVAVGELDAAVSLVGGLCSHDLAGGHALLIGAGKCLADRHGTPVRHGRGTFQGCLAGDPALVARLADLPLEGRAVRTRAPVRTRKPVRSTAMLARAQGCLLGQLAGDALGFAVEFLTGAEIARRHPCGITDLVDGGTWNLIAGQPTDDSEMALALARSLVREQGFNADRVAETYVAWMRSHPFDIGATTRTGISALERRTRPFSNSQSNGALMRACPIGISAAGAPTLAAIWAREDACLTHPNPVCRTANAAYAAAISTGVGGGDVEDMVASALAATGTGAASGMVRDRIEEARFSVPKDFYHQMGWVLTALHNAFHWLLLDAPLEEALIATVARGGDTDTNAAICGALLGAAQGRSAIPARWQEAILTCRAAPGTSRPRPAEYWPDDALKLAEALLAAGMAGTAEATGA
jgi:ADP-ribosylglycohydrolase/fructose-1,6-bisphosphatase/inositol monophosphatase family enzyme